MSDVVSYFFNSFLIEGAWIAVKITALAMVAGLALGLLLALMRLSSWKAVSGVAWVYIWIIRGTPLLLQLVFIYDALPRLGIRLDPFTTAVIGFALNEAAFAAEFIRGGILAVNRNQSIAAASLGMGPFLTLRRIVLPQAMRAITPQISNATISMLKGTSLASVIFVNELTFRAQQIVATNFSFFTVFIAAALLYLTMTTIIAWVQLLLERRIDPELRVAGARTTFLNRMFGTGTAQPQTNVADPKTGQSTPTSTPRLSRRFLTIAAVSAPDDGSPFVSCRGVRNHTAGRGSEREILRGVDFDVKRGEVVTIMGPSGSGKSTLLRLVNHLEALDGGEITVGGELVGYKARRTVSETGSRSCGARAAARIGMVFQHFNLFDHFTALENVMEAPIRVYGVSRRWHANARSRFLAVSGSRIMRIICRTAFWRPAAARRYRSCLGDQSESDAF